MQKKTETVAVRLNYSTYFSYFHSLNIILNRIQFTNNIQISQYKKLSDSQTKMLKIFTIYLIFLR